MWPFMCCPEFRDNVRPTLEPVSYSRVAHTGGLPRRLQSESNGLVGTVAVPHKTMARPPMGIHLFRGLARRFANLDSVQVHAGIASQGCIKVGGLSSEQVVLCFICGVRRSRLRDSTHCPLD
jgi:hypothetical protein